MEIVRRAIGYGSWFALIILILSFILGTKDVWVATDWLYLLIGAILYGVVAFIPGFIISLMVLHFTTKEK